MSEKNPMEEAMKTIDEQMNNIKKGDIVSGKVSSVSSDEILVDFGYVSDGIVKENDVLKNTEESLEDLFEIGDDISVKIIDLDDDEGNAILSHREASISDAWKALNDAVDSDEIFEVQVKEAVNGGVITSINGLRAFIPGSHLSVKYIDDMSVFVGEKLEVQVLEVDKSKNRIILSGKEAEKVKNNVLKKELYDTIQKGDRISGTVVNLAKFGAFVDIGGVEGLVHISQMSHKRIKHPSEVLTKGDVVDVVVLDMNKEDDKVSLRLADIKGNPWADVEKNYSEGSIVGAKIKKIASFGAFAELEPGVEGLIHISEISEDRVEKVENVLDVNQEVEVKILNIDMDKKRISLSIKEATGGSLDFFEDDEDGEVTIGDLFKDQLKDLL